MSACSCSQTENSAAEPSLPGTIRVGTTTISADEIMREAQNHPAEHVSDAAWDAARALAVRELLVQEADRQEMGPASAGETVKPAEIDQRSNPSHSRKRVSAIRDPLETPCWT